MNVPLYKETIREFGKDAIVGVTQTGIITRWNHTAEQLFGYSPQEIVGKDSSILFSAKQRIKNLTQKEKKTSWYPTIGIHKNKQHIPLTFTVFPLQVEKKYPTDYIIFFHNRTKEKHLEDALKENERMFELIVENSIDMIGIFDKHGRYIYASPSHEHILGYKNKDLLGKNLQSLVEPHDLTRLLKTQKKALQGKLAINSEFHLRHKDGHWITVEGAAQALLDEKGKPVFVIAKARDITEIKRFEENSMLLSKTSKILFSSLDYKHTLQSIAKLIAESFAEWSVIDLLTDEGKIKMVSIWHKDPEKRKIGMRFRKEFPRDISAPVGVGKAIRTGTSQMMVYEQEKEVIEKYAESKEYVRLLDQMKISVQISVPLKVHDKVIGATSLASSVPNKRFDANDIFFAGELAYRAALAIENARLYQEAQDVIASKNDLISMVSHELKTPVTSLKIHTQILQKKFAPIDTVSTTQFTKMEEQLNLLTDLINELLDFSRLQRKKLAYHKESFILGDLTKDIVETMQHTTKHMILLKGQTHRSIYGDKNRIGQVLTNLIANAIKYSGDEHTIIVNVREEEKNILVSVQDFGIGISKEHQKKIFERFYQVTDSVGRTFPGMGVGLYLSAEIIKEHQGEIWVDSEIGKGSTFSFRLPIESGR